MYTDENSIYNPILNEWDCSEFGKSEGSDSESGCDDYGDPYIDDEAQACDTDSTPFLTTITSAAGHDFEFKTLPPLEILHKFYGFVPPLPSGGPEQSINGLDFPNITSWSSAMLLAILVASMISCHQLKEKLLWFSSCNGPAILYQLQAVISLIFHIRITSDGQG